MFSNVIKGDGASVHLGQGLRSYSLCRLSYIAVCLYRALSNTVTHTVFGTFGVFRRVRKITESDY